MAIYTSGTNYIEVVKLAPNIPDVGSGKDNIGEAIINMYTTQANAEAKQRSIGSRRFIISEDVPANDNQEWSNYIDYNVWMKDEVNQLDGFLNFLKTQDGFDTLTIV